MLLIMSGAYVQQELGAEFGHIPPSFLPLANKRLFQHQVALNQEGLPVFLVLPECYIVTESDQKWLIDNCVNIIRVDSGLSLGNAIVTAFNLIEDKPTQSIRILLGDTLFKSLPYDYDIVSVSQSQDFYHWAHFGSNGFNADTSLRSRDVVCGYFAFSSANLFIKELVLNKFDFICALDKYRVNYGLTTLTVDDWLDFGHINTFYKSKVQYTTQRSFNELTITGESVEKSSVKHSKIEAESQWFSNIPQELKLYTPQLLKEYSDNSKSYKLEYLYNTALNELFVFSALPQSKLLNILSNCLTFVDYCKNSVRDSSSQGTISELFGHKTKERFQQFCSDFGFSAHDKWSFNDSEPVSVHKILQEIEIYLPTDLSAQTIMHGDLCFSNIIYDFRTERVKVIDPRGVTPTGELTIFGDYRYDIAKLSHSVIGLYDWIIAGYFNIYFDGDNKNIDFKLDINPEYFELQDAFVEIISDRYEIDKLSLYAMQIHLFLSMLPLHSDNKQRQQALFANAFRLYNVIKSIEA
ncbi:hypothetical protein [Aeromonas sp. FL131]|uniref:hypothetical protein n=1 Tax=Aeromonas sp. FL131 TaxID=3416715 RepID=UPI003CE8A7BD